MSGSFSIQKGKRAERAVASALNPILARICLAAGVPTWKLTRNLSQTQAGGFDLAGLDWIAIEIKHHAELRGLPGWWQQTLRQAEPRQDQRGVVTYDKEPVLIYKNNGTRWRVRMLGRLDLAPGRRLRVPVDISWDDFLVWFEKRVQIEAAKMAPEEKEQVGLFS